MTLMELKNTEPEQCAREQVKRQDREQPLFQIALTLCYDLNRMKHNGHIRMRKRNFLIREKETRVALFLRHTECVEGESSCLHSSDGGSNSSKNGPARDPRAETETRLLIIQIS